MSTPTITPQTQENPVEKTLLFLEQHFPNRKEFTLDYLQLLLLNPTQRLPALVVHLTQDSTGHRLPQLVVWIRALSKYVSELEISKMSRKIIVRDYIELRYLNNELYEQLESAQIHNVFAFLKPNDFDGINEVAIIPLPALPQNLVSLEELENEIPDFTTFLQSRPGYYPQSGELYFSREIYQPASVLAAK